MLIPYCFTRNRLENKNFLFTFVNSMNKRLIQFLNTSGISQAVLADTLGVARANVSHIISGRNKPGFDFIESLSLHYPELNIEWLITGRGRMLKSPNDANQDDLSKVQTLDDSIQTIEKKRVISKIMVFFDDNTFEEFHP